MGAGRPRFIERHRESGAGLLGGIAHVACRRLEQILGITHDRLQIGGEALTGKLTIGPGHCGSMDVHVVYFFWWFDGADGRNEFLA